MTPTFGLEAVPGTWEHLEPGALARLKATKSEVGERGPTLTPGVLGSHLGERCGCDTREASVHGFPWFARPRKGQPSYGWSSDGTCAKAL